MSYYEDVYKRRINRFGNDYQSRLQGQREKVFEDLLCKSIYRVDFVYNDIMEPGILEPYKQDDTQTLQYLLTKLDLVLPGGTVLEIDDQHGHKNMWMVYWLEQIQASGYNRYVMMKMTHRIKWTHQMGKLNPTYFYQFGYLYGQQDKVLRNSSYGKVSLYFEKTKNNTLIMPFTPDLLIDDYFDLKNGDIVSAYRVVGIDIQSTPGVQFVTLDPVYEFDKSATPQKPHDDTSNDYDWFTGNFSED